MRGALAARGLLWPLFALREPLRVRQGSVRERVAWRARGCNFRERLVTSATDVCIEGFPRSANSYAVDAFMRQNRDARVAHHLHAPFQVRRAVRLEVPCCLLVRAPLPAITSVLAMYRDRLSPAACCRSYIRFHRAVLPLRDRVVVCRFEEVIAEPAVLVERLNRRYGTSFAAKPMSPQLELHLARRLRGRAHRVGRTPDDATLATPTFAKEARKAAIESSVAALPMLREAEALYETLVEDGGGGGVSL